MKHFGYAVARRKLSQYGKFLGYEKLKNTGRFVTRAGAEEFVRLYQRLHPGADIHVIEDIRGDKEEKKRSSTS